MIERIPGPDPRITRRSFLQGTSALSALAAAAPLALNSLAAADKRPSRMTYDVSRFSVTDPKLIQYEAARVIPKVASHARRIIALSGDGFMVAAEQGAIEFSAEGTATREFRTPTPARCLARARDGTVYVGTREGIYSFEKDGRKLAFWPVASGKAWITGLAVSENDLFAADSGNRVVMRYDLAGKVVGRIGEKDKDRNVPGLILPSPYLGVALGRDGLLRVNNTGRHRVELYTADGDLEQSWGKPTAAIEGFCGCCNPVGLALLTDGRYVTAEKGLPRVKVYSAAGLFESVVSGTESFPENTRHGAAREADGTMGGLDVAAAEDGKVLILDLVTGNVHVMRPKKV